MVDRKLRNGSLCRGSRMLAVLLLGPIGLSMGAAAQKSHTTWREYLGGPDSSHYSALKQINRSNVSQLQVAWTYPTGDDVDYAFNPIIVYNMMYVLAKNFSVVALDAASGREIWEHPIRPGEPLIKGRGGWGAPKSRASLPHRG